MELVKGPVVLDLIRAVPVKLLSVPNGVTVSVLHINLVDLNVDLDLIIMLLQNKMIMKIMIIMRIKMITMTPKELLAMK